MRIISLIVALCLATSSFGAVNGRLQASIDSVAALPSGGTVFIPALVAHDDIHNLNGVIEGF